MSLKHILVLEFILSAWTSLNHNLTQQMFGNQS